MTQDDSQHLNKYEDSEPLPNTILVIGVGGGGSNAVNHMYHQNVKGVSFVVTNTDRAALQRSPVTNRVLLGPTVTRGRGAGNDPEKARMAAEESAPEIDKLFTPEIDMVFITASMGGGTGTGAAPVVARVARERGLLTVGIVTVPFIFEGMKKITKALRGADELRKHVDALLVINNERLTEIYPDFAFENSLAKADDTLSTAALSISEIITNDGYINLDFNDVQTTLRDGGTALISIGYGEGEHRVTDAINDALHSPLLKDTDVFSSRRLLFNLSYSRSAEQVFRTEEASALSAFVSKIDSKVEVDVIWGIHYDDTLGNKVKLTILAAGFDASNGKNAEPRVEQVSAAEAVSAATEVDAGMISSVYGKERIEEVQRIKNRQRHTIIDDDHLDDDEQITHLEKEPAYTRERRLSQTVKAVESTPQRATEAQTQHQQSAAQTSAAKGNVINFDADDL